MPDTYQNPGFATSWTVALFTSATVCLLLINTAAWVIGAQQPVSWGWAIAPFGYLVVKSTIFNLIFNAVHGAVRQAENDANIEVFNDHVNLNKEEAEDTGDVFYQMGLSLSKSLEEDKS